MSTTTSQARPLFDLPIVRGAILESFKKLDPRHQVRNPVMFVVFIGSLLTTALIFMGEPGISRGFIIGVTVWLWFTVLFANFAEAMAEGRGKAQADTLKKSRRDVMAKQLSQPKYGAAHTQIAAGDLRKGDVVLAEAGDFIPVDGEVIKASRAWMNRLSRAKAHR